MDKSKKVDKCIQTHTLQYNVYVCSNSYVQYICKLKRTGAKVRKQKCRKVQKCIQTHTLHCITFTTVKTI